MPLDQDAMFGVCYLSVAEFEASAQIFGVGASQLPTDQDITRAYLAAASRWVEAKTGKIFTPDLNHVEMHTLNPLNSRLVVNNPPVLSISDYRILTGATTFSSVSPANLFINNQENWVELLMQPFVLPGITDLIVQITYKSSSDVKQNIKLATGYVAASLIGDSSVASKFPTGIKSIKIGSQAQITREDTSKTGGNLDLSVPPIVGLLLANDVAIGIA